MPFPMLFTDHVTIIPSDWLNAVNNAVVSFLAGGGGGGTFPALPLSVANGGTGVTSSTGTGNAVLSEAPAIDAPTITGGTVDGFGFGYKSIPQNSQGVNYTLQLSDSGKHVYHPSGDVTARTYTIPANSSVPYPIGTELVFINDNGAGVLTIAIGGTDTMRLAGTGVLGNRTLAANGVASAIKLTATSWIINGSNLT